MLHDPIQSGRLTYTRRAQTNEVDTLIETHAKQVNRIAWHVHARMSSAIDLADLVQIGMVALVEAARVFQDRGIPFGVYAQTRIRGAMIDHLRRGAAVSRSSIQNRRKLEAVRAKVEADLCRHASDGEVAAAMGVDPETYHQVLSSSSPIRQDSLDEVYSDQQMWFAALADDAHTALEKAEIAALLQACVGNLPSREAMILQLYFVDEMNLDEIGQILEISAARVCQIKAKTLKSLRQDMQAKIN
jgi:RNA polymerase sigma factor for flagellar operon FliA